LNGAECVISDDNDDALEVTYACSCPYTHDGFFCEYAVDIATCLDGHQCVNGGQCVPSDDNDEFQLIPSYACECPDSHHGDFCHVLNTNERRSKNFTPGTTAGIVLGGLLGMAVMTLLIVSATKPRQTRHVVSTAAGEGELVLEPDGTSTMNGAMDNNTVEDSTDIPSPEFQNVIV
jgi:hypothetical protein